MRLCPSARTARRRRPALLAGEVGEWEAGEDDAAECEHSGGALDQIGVQVEVRFIGKPVECPARLGDRGHGRLGGFQDVDPDVHAGMGGKPVPAALGGNLAGFGIEDDPSHVSATSVRRGGPDGGASSTARAGQLNEA